MNGIRVLHLFAGAGGGLLADLILGHRPVAAVEWDAYACSVLRERAADGWFPDLHVHEGDIRLFNPSEYAGRVDCVSGGFPCQDVSVAGSGKGLDGERSGLWSEFARVLCVIRPRFAFIENSPALTTRGLDRVLSDIAALGFDAEWAVISAAEAGASHERKRIWILAHAARNRRRTRRTRRSDTGDSREQKSSFQGSNAHGLRKLQPQGSEQKQRGWARDIHQVFRHVEQWSTEPELARMVHGVPYSLDRTRCLGNAQVPLQAALAWRILERRLGVAE